MARFYLVDVFTDQSSRTLAASRRCFPKENLGNFKIVLEDKWQNSRVVRPLFPAFLGNLTDKAINLFQVGSKKKLNYHRQIMREFTFHCGVTNYPSVFRIIGAISSSPLG